MATKKVAPASQAGLVGAAPVNGAAAPAVVPPHLQPKPAAKKPVVKVERKTSIQTVQNGLSSRKETEKTVPYVVLRKPTKPGGKVTRQIVQFIQVGDTEAAGHVRSMRICVVKGAAFGTNLNVGTTDLRKARLFQYGADFAHAKNARTVQPWDFRNDKAVQALYLLGFITSYELEFHRDEAKRLCDAFLAAEKAKQKSAKLNSFVAQVKLVAKEHGAAAVRDALKRARVIVA